MSPGSLPQYLPKEIVDERTDISYKQCLK